MRPRVCSVTDCPGSVQARALCHAHYMRWHRGQPLDAPLRYRESPGTSTVERFMSYVSKTDTCWLWTGQTNPKGYGSFSLAGRTRRAHRVAYELFVGPIPDGLQIDHVLARGCTNRNCVNPAHLEPVTPAENIRRGKRGAKPHCRAGHPYTPENTRFERGARTCRTCDRLRKRERDRRRKLLLAAATVAATLTLLPGSAGADTNPTYEGRDCRAQGCTGPEAAVDCWYPQADDWRPDRKALDPTRVRQRARDGRWEVLARTDAASCPEVIPGSGWRVARGDLAAVRAYVKAQALAETNSTELYGEVVPWSYWVDAFARRVAMCESGGQWHAHRDGLLQIIPSTWRAYGGLEFARYAGEATPAQQLEIAGRVYDGQGPSAWTCKP